MVGRGTSGAGMLRSGWSWSAGGDLMLESGMLRCALDTACVGWIAVISETEPSAPRVQLSMPSAEVS